MKTEFKANRPVPDKGPLKMNQKSAKRMAVLDLNDRTGLARLVTLVETGDAAAMELYLKTCAAYIKTCLDGGTTISTDKQSDSWGLNNFDYEKFTLGIESDIVAAFNSGNFDRLVIKSCQLVSAAQDVLSAMRRKGAGPLDWYREG
jgi:hypothetical protein